MIDHQARSYEILQAETESLKEYAKKESRREYESMYGTPPVPEGKIHIQLSQKVSGRNLERQYLEGEVVSETESSITIGKLTNVSDKSKTITIPKNALHEISKKDFLLDEDYKVTSKEDNWILKNGAISFY